jgi:hypothetical protein
MRLTPQSHPRCSPGWWKKTSWLYFALFLAFKKTTFVDCHKLKSSFYKFKFDSAKVLKGRKKYTQRCTYNTKKI